MALTMELFIQRPAARRAIMLLSSPEKEEATACADSLLVFWFPYMGFSVFFLATPSPNSFDATGSSLRSRGAEGLYVLRDSLRQVSDGFYNSQVRVYMMHSRACIYSATTPRHSAECT